MFPLVIILTTIVCFLTVASIAFLIAFVVINPPNKSNSSTSNIEDNSKTILLDKLAIGFFGECSGGTSISLNADGTILVCGAPDFRGGSLWLYSYNGNGTWTLVNSPFLPSLSIVMNRGCLFKKNKIFS